MHLCIIQHTASGRTDLPALSFQVLIDRHHLVITVRGQLPIVKACVVLLASVSLSFANPAHSNAGGFPIGRAGCMAPSMSRVPSGSSNPGGQDFPAGNAPFHQHRQRPRIRPTPWCPTTRISPAALRRHSKVAWCRIRMMQCRHRQPCPRHEWLMRTNSFTRTCHRVEGSTRTRRSRGPYPLVVVRTPALPARSPVWIRSRHRGVGGC